MTNLVKFTTDDVKAANRASNASPEMALSELFAQWHYKPVFSENLFERSELASAVFHVILDRVGKGKEQISVAYIRGCNEGRIALTFEQILFRDDTCLIVADEYDWQYLVVFPISARKFDEHGRISKEEECLTTITNRELIVKPPCDIDCSLNIYCARDLLSLTEPNRNNVERRVFAIYGELGITPLFLGECLIEGKIYDIRWLRENGVRRNFQEQVGYLAYGYYDTVARATGKPFYGAAKILIAYSLALHLPKDGCFRNGLWSPRMETHFRFEAEALSVLTRFYETHGGRRIAQACERIACAMTQHVDKLQNGMVWFLHDTLENTDETEVYYPTLLPSCAFGKNPRNTLTLNTHLCTLTALTRYSNFFQDDSDTRAVITQGEKALSTVLFAPCAKTTFLLLYTLYNRLYGLRRIPGVGRILSWLRKALLVAKRRSPVLAMPNGAIERDLSASSFSRRYHVVNLYDLLLVYDIIDWPGIVSLIQKGIDYVVRENIHRENIRGHQGTRYWPLVLLRSLSLEKAPHAVRRICLFLDEYGETLRDCGLQWPVHIFADSRFSNTFYTALRDLPLDYDLFEFSFQRKRYWALLGESTTDWSFPGTTLVKDLSESGCVVLAVPDVRTAPPPNSVSTHNLEELRKE